MKTLYLGVPNIFTLKVGAQIWGGGYARAVLLRAVASLKQIIIHR